MQTMEQAHCQVLTLQEFQTYELIRQGYTQREAGAQLGYTDRHIRNLMKRALAKLADTMEEEREGKGSFKIAYKRPWQGGDVAYTTDTTPAAAHQRITGFSSRG